ncbi:MAG: RNA polymerase sigma-70 factor [Bacteroidetes bacterium]|nr:RNA polymerase sigma-70 factor [Bacteroidota bacterium]
MHKKEYKNDTDALLNMAEGDINAYRFLFDHHFSDLCNFLLIYLHSRELSEEIALEIYTYIWEKRETLHVNTTFKSFLFSSAKNKAISLYRKEQKNKFTSLETEESEIYQISSAQHVMENKELRQIIEAAISKLPEKSRQVYQMAWEDNLSHKEIAMQLGMSPKTVENHVGIALRRLRELLKPYYEQIFLIWLLYFFID